MKSGSAGAKHESNFKTYAYLISKKSRDCGFLRIWQNSSPYFNEGMNFAELLIFLCVISCQNMTMVL